MSEPSDQTPTPTDDPARAGSSIDTVLGKIVVERRLLSQTELDDCNEAILTRAQSSAPTTLADLLVERDFVTRKQLDRLRGDADTAKTSSQLPGYEIIRQIGKGAMGKVYLGRDQRDEEARREPKRGAALSPRGAHWRQTQPQQHRAVRRATPSG